MPNDRPTTAELSTPPGMTLMQMGPGGDINLTDRQSVANGFTKLFAQMADAQSKLGASHPKTTALENAVELLGKHLGLLDAGTFTDLDASAVAASKALQDLAATTQKLPSQTAIGGYPIRGSKAIGILPKVEFATIPEKTKFPFVMGGRRVSAAAAAAAAGDAGATGSTPGMVAGILKNRAIVGQGNVAMLGRMMMGLPGWFKVIPLALATIEAIRPKVPRAGAKEQDVDTVVQASKMTAFLPFSGGFFSVALLSVTRHLGEFGHAVLESRRGLALYNGAIANAFAQVEFHRIGLDIAKGAALQRTTSGLARAQMDLGEVMQPINILGAKLLNILSIGGTKAATFFATLLSHSNELRLLRMIANGLEKFVKKEDTQALPIVQAVRGLAQGMAQPIPDEDWKRGNPLPPLAN